MWDNGCDDPSLIEHRDQIDKMNRVKCDNASDLVNAIRTGNDSVIQSIVNKVMICIKHYRTPGHKHPMRCGCCRHMTHLNQDGIRVRDVDGKVHYVCNDWKQSIRELCSNDRTHVFIRELLETCNDNI